MSGHQAGPEDFKLEKGYEPLATKTLEEIISEGESLEEKEKGSERITVNNFAQWLRSVGIHLKHKHKNATNVSVIERSMIKIGIAIVRQNYNPLIQQIQSLRESIFETGNQIHLMKTYGTSSSPRRQSGQYIISAPFVSGRWEPSLSFLLNHWGCPPPQQYYWH